MKSARSRSPSPTLKSKKLEPAVSVAAFLFRRDFRTVDNTALQSLIEIATKESLPILPLFFFNPVQCDEDKNAYFGKACFQFLCESLEDLDKHQLNNNLVCLRGTDQECLQTIKEHGLSVRVLGYNADFTPFSLIRDACLNKTCAAEQIVTVVSAEEYTLLPLDTVVKDNEQPYSVFSAFYKRLLSDFSTKIKPPSGRNWNSSCLLKDAKQYFPKSCVTPTFEPLPRISDHGGRTEGLKRLEHVSKMKKYGEERNLIPEDLTSHLSPHLKFGTVSVREVWAESVASLGLHHEFVRQLVWREFYASLLHHHPRLAKAQLNIFATAVIAEHSGASTKKEVTRLNDPFMVKYLSYKWKWEPEHFEQFKTGNTGVPLVDAAVRCLTATGWCHNRCRMVIANFLVKVLHVDWREGERWFATVAVDYDVSNNSGGWQWSSGQGADPQPYFRTFNPFRQSANFDPECRYIYEWVPELKQVPPEVIHRWDEYCTKHKVKAGASFEKKSPTKASATRPMDKVYETSYCAPIVDIKKCTQNVIANFKTYDKK
ncbi:DNA photolyase/FAD binding domain of DNA photolyase, putative [Angomonas deanei]|uniref:DNA photolyase/FAD binding domain of DNA photolyase, putative n=1 Tax=Angomonas deanei TaxID=59799 RepID=A0A7G2CHX4_9TRYP|nr:DNA photolyase/FAD binding domain of DNA photolyase, putative [Angomonas deanei]